MTDTIDHDRGDRDVAAAVHVATIEPIDRFRAALRAEIEATAHDVVVLRSDDVRRGRRTTWPVLIAAAAAVVLLVAAAITLRSPGDADLDPAEPITPDTESGALLVGNALAQELTGRSWIAVERFDVDVTPTRLAEVTFTGDDDDLVVDVPTCATPTTATGRIEDDRLELDLADDLSCGGEGLRLTARQGIDMRPGASTFMLSDDAARPVATFVDVDSLESPTIDDLTAQTWYSAELVPMDVTWPDIVHIGWCTRLTAEDVGSGLRVSPGADIQGACAGAAPSRWDEVESLIRAVTADGAIVHRSDAGVVLRSSAGAVLFRPAPSIEVDPTTATVGAGALFGVETGVGIAVDEIDAAARPVVGAATFDSGWVIASSTSGDRAFFTCGAAGAEYRELHWDDIVASFWRVGSRTTFASWHVGERPKLVAVPDVGAPESTTTSELATTDGVRIGDSLAAVPRRFGYNWENVGETRAEGTVGVFSRNPAHVAGDVADELRSGIYQYRDGVVTGFGSGAPRFEC